MTEKNDGHVDELAQRRAVKQKPWSEGLRPGDIEQVDDVMIMGPLEDMSHEDQQTAIAFMGLWSNLNYPELVAGFGQQEVVEHLLGMFESRIVGIRVEESGESPPPDAPAGSQVNSLSLAFNDQSVLLYMILLFRAVFDTGLVNKEDFFAHFSRVLKEVKRPGEGADETDDDEPPPMAS